MKKIIAIFAIFLVIAASGCLGRGGDQIIFTRGYGLEITNFSSPVGQVYSDQTAHVTMIVENHGGSKIDKTKGLALIILPGDWTVTQNKNQPFKKDLHFEDEVRGTIAGAEYFTWSIKAPSLVSGQTRPDSITGRVFYDYTTTAIGNIWVYPESEAASERDKGNTMNTLTYKASRGPVAISISVVPDPVTVYSDGEVFSLNIGLTNVGGGVVYKDGEVTSSSYDVANIRNQFTLDVDIAGLTVDKSCLNNLEFFGDTATTICDVTVADAPPTKQSYPITVTADYGYYTDKIIQMNIVGR